MSDLIELNKQLINEPVEVTTWNGYGVVVNVKDENTFLVMNKWREIKEVDKFYIRTLTEEQSVLYKSVFNNIVQ